MVELILRARVINDDTTSFLPRYLEGFFALGAITLVVPILATSVYSDHIATGLVHPTTSPVHRGLRVDRWELRETHLDARWPVSYTHLTLPTKRIV